MLNRMSSLGRKFGPRAAKLEDVLVPDPPAFALLHRPESTVHGQLEILIGTTSVIDRIEDIPLITSKPGVNSPIHDMLAIIPFRQIAERGFDIQDDGAPLIILTVGAQGSLPVTEALRMLPDVSIALLDTGCDMDDDAYAAIVRRILRDEIGRGEGSNFVIKRTFVAEINKYSVHTALAIFRRLMVSERGAYWTFIVHTGDRTFIGATPERHATLAGGIVTMNPISGTFRYSSSDVSPADVLRFLADRKEGDELSMVLDEELKMLSRVCQLGAYVSGPYLKEMAHLAHTEYLIRGHSSLNVRQILRETMFSPAVTGSPLESACRVIGKYEPCGRGYYSGVLALISWNATGEHILDSSILIRTADIDRYGTMQIAVGSTLVRDSDPDTEVAETWAKARGLLGVFEQSPANFSGVMTTMVNIAKPHPRIGDDPEVRRALDRRNKSLATFWFSDPKTRNRVDPSLIGCRTLVIEAEDSFTEMLGHQLRSLGLDITFRRFDEDFPLAGFDLIIVGPGPGNPQDLGNRKIARLYTIVRQILNSGLPLFCVCLSHQILSSIVGFELIRKQIPNQGIQREIQLFGQRRRVGFYNTFVAQCGDEPVQYTGIKSKIEVSSDEYTGEVHALRGHGFASVQFHPESVLTEDGVSILQEILLPMLARRTI